jgi:hypothetical protein
VTEGREQLFARQWAAAAESSELAVAAAVVAGAGKAVEWEHLGGRG